MLGACSGRPERTAPRRCHQTFHHCCTTQALTGVQPVAAHQVDQQAGQGEEAGQDGAFPRGRQHK